jgi:O-antigen biosynthesis protein
LVKELQQTLPRSDSPVVSIIIPVYNQLSYTLRCLKSISSNLTNTVPVEIIVINDDSGDRTQEVLTSITAITLIDNPINCGFIHSCNHGVSLAKAAYLYFLNNDTEIKPNCVESLLEVITQPQVGAVGSKLVYPQGTLQEAGGIVWQDAAAWNYGRHNNPNAPEYNYLRPVDYCSGASLMVRKDAFLELNGFEIEFAPAYYEDTDLCLALRHKLGLKVMYQPKSEVIHYEGISSGTSTVTGVKQYQIVNADKFKHKWQHLLNSYPVNQGIKNTPFASRKYLGPKTVLVIDSYMPNYDRESGSRRLFEILKIFKNLNFHVIFAADNGYKAEPYTSALQELQIEVLYTQSGYGTTIEQQIEQRLSWIDLAWISRPELNQKYAGLIRQNQQIKVIYDTIDLHYLRLKRAWELTSNPEPKERANWSAMQALELSMAHQSDLTITVTSIEQKILQEQSVNNVAVIPNVHFPYHGDLPEFNQRSGILFIGGYNHPPNVDGVKWLCQEIMPLVWQQQPELKVTLLGSNPTAEVKSLASDRVKVTGYINDVTPYFLSHKLSVSPLRYGAGMKGKIGQSLEYSLPIVSTEIGTEGINLTPEQDILEANNTLDFAQQILRLHNDAELWSKLSSNSFSAIRPYNPQKIQQQLAAIINRLFLNSQE